MKTFWLTLSALLCLAISNMALAAPCDHAKRDGRAAYERCLDRHGMTSRHHRGPGPGRDFVSDRCYERYGRSPRFHDCVRKNRDVVNYCQHRYGSSSKFRDCVHRRSKF